MVRLIEKYLTEDIEAVKKQYSYIPEEDFDRIIRLDPTFDENRDSVGKYGKWLLGLYKKTNGNYPTNTKSILSKYDQYKNDRTKDIEKDIMRFGSIDELTDVVDNAGEATLSKKQAQRQAKKDKPYDLVFSGDVYDVYVPRNQRGDMVLASLGGSKKATWCTAVDDDSGAEHYDDYLASGGKYYVLINKNDYDDKYQFHFESEQYMDANNCGINLEEFGDENPDLIDFFEGEGYNWDDWARVPSDPDRQKDMIEDFINENGFESIDADSIFAALDSRDFMPGRIADQCDYFYDCDAREQFDNLESVGVKIGYDVTDSNGKTYQRFGDFDNCYQALRLLGVDDFCDWADNWANKRYQGYTTKDYFEEIYGDPARNYELFMSFVDESIEPWDYAEYIVDEIGEGYDFCEWIVRNR